MQKYLVGKEINNFIHNKQFYNRITRLLQMHSLSTIYLFMNNVLQSNWHPRKSLWPDVYELSFKFKNNRPIQILPQAKS